MAFQIVLQEGLLHVPLSGTLSRADLDHLASAIEKLEAPALPVPNRIIDLTRVTEMAIDFADVLAIAERRKQQRFPNSFRTALVAGRPIGKGYARMFQALNDHPQITIEVFSDRETALRWLAQ
jgi:hypothetical protein